VFAGSTNRDDYLTDPAGERRFWIVRCADAADLEGLAAMRDQLWREALDAYMAGEAWTLSPEVAALARAAQQHRVEEDPWESVLGRYLGDQGVNDTCVRQCINWLRMENENTNAGNAHHRVGRCLKTLGFRKEEKKRRFPGFNSPVFVWNRCIPSDSK
jgi:predicted P-loop ATPase